eukprot:TRINITY_DN15722_c0_g1_i1.p1 TRINITY_DN15722_c0_g1~~TRINITY_DN15722_c0_g1_i1.p1  ORF type:complete len:250 (+),score=34.67 TRINITY_DN15722_c0_g1_i1:201-950(+)
MPSKNQRRIARRQSKKERESVSVVEVDVKDLTASCQLLQNERVVVHSLSRRSDLNGRRAFVSHFLPNGRVAVVLEDEPIRSAIVSVARENLFTEPEAKAVVHSAKSTAEVYEEDWVALAAAQARDSDEHGEADPYFEELEEEYGIMEVALLLWRTCSMAKDKKRRFLQERARHQVQAQMHYVDWNIQLPYFGANYFLSELKRVRTEHLSPRSAALWSLRDVGDYEAACREDRFAEETFDFSYLQEHSFC